MAGKAVQARTDRFPLDGADVHGRAPGQAAPSLTYAFPPSIPPPPLARSNCLAHAFRERRDERRLPGLPYNAKQLFFVSSCVKWCASGDAKWGQRYAPWWKRCNVPLTHLEDFAEAFECAPGTPMNPPARCSFW
ncbi:hypothetical protein HPB48_026647 [Haemaphysalis longicornis]|uniref:Peptidase M13 C-terminal domain-containing protein n=1 Tax=Haemaphysalis longicornis TaxID=44386 RepID=A0A9J6HCU4_HAELO|nr:hypothetical protein HPB48_026647 [Haemaphysalis longicornis]